MGYSPATDSNELIRVAERSPMRWKPNLLQIILLLAAVIVIAKLASDRGIAIPGDRVLSVDGDGEHAARPVVVLARDRRDLVKRVLRARSHEVDRKTFGVTELDVDAESLAGMVMAPRGGTFYLLERDGTLRKGRMTIAPEETERVELGVEVAAFGAAKGGLVVVPSDRDEVWTISKKDYRTFTRISIPDLESVASEMGSAYGVAMAGGQRDPSRRRLVLMNLIRGTIKGSWTARAGDWTIETQSGQRRLESIDAVAIGARGGSIYVLDRTHLWRFECCDDAGLRVQDFEADVVEERDGSLVATGSYVTAFGEQGGRRSTSGERRLQVRSRNLAPFVELDLPIRGSLQAVAIQRISSVLLGLDHRIVEYVRDKSSNRSRPSLLRFVAGRRASLESSSGRILELTAPSESTGKLLVRASRGLYLLE